MDSSNYLNIFVFTTPYNVNSECTIVVLARNENNYVYLLNSDLYVVHYYLYNILYRTYRYIYNLYIGIHYIFSPLEIHLPSYIFSTPFKC